MLMLMLFLTCRSGLAVAPATAPTISPLEVQRNGDSQVVCMPMRPLHHVRAGTPMWCLETGEAMDVTDNGLNLAMRRSGRVESPGAVAIGANVRFIQPIPPGAHMLGTLPVHQFLSTCPGHGLGSTTFCDGKGKPKDPKAL